MKQSRINRDYLKGEIVRAYNVLGIKAEADNHLCINVLFNGNYINSEDWDYLLKFNKELGRKIAKELWG